VKDAIWLARGRLPHIQRDIVFPKSVNPARIRENFEIFDFELADADVKAIRALSRNKGVGPSPDTFAGSPRADLALCPAACDQMGVPD